MEQPCAWDVQTGWMDGLQVGKHLDASINPHVSNIPHECYRKILMQYEPMIILSIMK